MWKSFSPSFKIFFVLLFIFTLTASGSIDSIDGVTDIYMAKKVLFSKTIAFSPKDNRIEMPVAKNGIDGKYYTLHNAGYSIMQIPGVLLSSVIRNINSQEQTDFPYESDFIITVWANLINAVIISIVGVLIFRLAIIMAGDKVKKYWYLTIPLVLSSNLFIQAHQHFAHPLATVLFLISFMCLIEYLDNPKAKSLVKFCASFTLLAVSYNLSFMLFIPALSLYVFLKKRKFLVQILTATIPSFLFQALWNQVRFGKVSSSGYELLGVQLTDYNPLHFFMRFFALTVGLNKGLFVYSPILLLILLVLLRGKIRKEMILFIALLFTFLVNYSLMVWWHGDAAYGPRFFTPVLALGLAILLSYIPSIYSSLQKWLLFFLMVIGLLIQLPGVFIPSFAFPFLSPDECRNYDVQYSFNPRCSPIKVGWSHLLHRRIKETILSTGNMGKIQTISLTYPNPVKSFRTIYPDPLFDRFSKYKTTEYKLDKNMMNDIYSFTLDIWWIKGILYKNVFNL